MPHLSLRLHLDPDGRIGPGKIELLERIMTCGSIAAAGREMGMSYRRAWELVDEMNGIFGKRLVERQVGGKHGGGAQLTDLGMALIARYRAIERASEAAASVHLAALQIEVDRTPEPTTEPEDQLVTPLVATSTGSGR
jgi:molybdate transport system regulatory protein